MSGLEAGGAGFNPHNSGGAGADYPHPPASNWLAETAFEYASRLFYVLLYMVVIGIIMGIVLFIATCIYAFFYWLIIPKATLVVPVFIDYRLSGGSRDLWSPSPERFAPFDEGERYLQTLFARANVSLIGKQWQMSSQVESLHKRQYALLSTRETYDVYLDLEFREGRLNDNCGVVNVITDVLHHTSSSSSALTTETTSPSEIFGEKGKTVIHLARSVRSFVPSKSTWVVRMTRKFFFLAPLVAGVIQETEAYSVKLLEEYIEHGSYRATQVNLEFSGDKLFVAEAKLRFSVQLGGLRWFIKNWFFTSATVGIAQIFMFLMTVVLILYYFIFLAPSGESLQDRPAYEPRQRQEFKSEREKKE